MALKLIAHALSLIALAATIWFVKAWAAHRGDERETGVADTQDRRPD